MELFNKIEEVMKDKKKQGIVLPEIRYFDGPEMFCDLAGNYKAETLANSLKLWLNQEMAE